MYVAKKDADIQARKDLSGLYAQLTGRYVGRLRLDYAAPPAMAARFYGDMKPCPSHWRMPTTALYSLWTT